MEVAKLKAQLAATRADIREKDRELDALTADLPFRLGGEEASMQGESLDSSRGARLSNSSSGPLPRRLDSEAEADHLTQFRQLEDAVAALQSEVRQQGERMAWRLAGLVAGTQRLAEELLQEREDRRASIAEVWQLVEHPRDDAQASAGLTKRLETVESCMAEAKEVLQRHCEEISADFKALEESASTRMAELTGAVEDLAHRQAASALAPEVTAEMRQKPSEDAELVALASPTKQWPEEPVVDDAAEELMQSMRQLEKEVPLLAKAIISSSKEMTDRIENECSQRLEAEARLEAKLKQVALEVQNVTLVRRAPTLTRQEGSEVSLRSEQVWATPVNSSSVPKAEPLRRPLIDAARVSEGWHAAGVANVATEPTVLLRRRSVSPARRSSAPMASQALPQGTASLVPCQRAHGVVGRPPPVCRTHGDCPHDTGAATVRL
eukprot:TRINITY_DN28154_c0_g1_i1.p1 TRINITY_DN28154_c0_g1~~TRINITY_DN28154_c0_g1_i1.p1  ORF type:complete len:438 (-),score=109.64 TRINITY_DN28154_c0_g1_i1:39-1352(-)